MKPNDKQIKAFELIGVDVVVDDTMTRLTYHTNHDGEECEDDARAIAQSMLEKDTVAEGDWQKIEVVVDEITPCDEN